jgi:5'-deoxynucleotidase YfbR-like HD superfamily hydrolase
MSTILLHSGCYFDFNQPEASDFSLDDIAHGLSNLCRFTGQCREFYSVAQHSFLASYLVPPPYALQALMHDAAEALVGDMSSPLKQMLPAYKEIELRVERAIFARFGLPEHLHPCVKQADLVMLATEQRDLMDLSCAWKPWECLEGIDPKEGWTIAPRPPREAKAAFISRFIELTNAVKGLAA